jgi:glycosyltransferase involved in cell wall biosynthesis
MIRVVTVVIPTRNSARTIEACLRSIKKQTYPRVEVIVVDNASDDATPAIAHEYADLFLSEGPERSSQRNIGARCAHGAYLLFVDSDMVLDLNVVAQCVSAIEESSAPALIIPEMSVGEGFWAHCRALERSCYSGDELIEAARFYRRDAFELSGGFDEAIAGFEDWDLCLRVGRGAALPRIGAVIFHDEGRLRLRNHLAKKRYYARSFRRYRQKHGAIALRQVNVIGRSAFLRNWERLVRHPVLTPGLVLLKTLELAAGAIGILDGGEPLLIDKAPSSSKDHRHASC